MGARSPGHHRRRQDGPRTGSQGARGPDERRDALRGQSFPLRAELGVGEHGQRPADGWRGLSHRPRNRLRARVAGSRGDGQPSAHRGEGPRLRGLRVRRPGRDAAHSRGRDGRGGWRADLGGRAVGHRRLRADDGLHADGRGDGARGRDGDAPGVPLRRKRGAYRKPRGGGTLGLLQRLEADARKPVARPRAGPPPHPPDL